MSYSFSARYLPHFKGTLLATLVLAAAIMGTYHWVVTTAPEDLAGGYDVNRAAGPLNFYLDYWIHQGQIPLWNPLSLCGMPFAANPVTMFYYPFNLLRSILTSEPTPLKTQYGWVIMTGLHVLAMGLGTVFLARSHRMSYSAALVAAFALIFSAIWTRRISEYHFVYMVAWLPWLLLITRIALEERSILVKVWWGLWGALLLGISLLSGAMNIAPYFALCIGVYALLHRMLLTHREGRGPILRTLTGDVFYLCTVFALGAALAAAFLLPGYEFASFSSRAADSGVELRSPSYNVPFSVLFQELIRFPGLAFKHEGIRAAGICVLVLALASLLSQSRRVVFLYLAFFLVLFDCSLGSPFPFATLVEVLSPLQMIGSNRAFDFALLPLGLLAGLGLDAVSQFDRAKWLVVLRTGVIFAGGFLLSALSGLLGPETYLGMGQIALVPGLLLLAVIMLASHLSGVRFWRVSMLLLVFVETFLWNQAYIPSIIVSENFAHRAGTFDGNVSFWQDNSRGIHGFQNRHLYALYPVMHGYEPVHITRVREVLSGGVRQRRYQRSVQEHEITQENNRGNLLFKRSFWLTRQYVLGPLPGKHSLFPPTTTVYLKETPTLPLKQVEQFEVPSRAVSEQHRVAISLDVEQLAAVNRSLSGAGRTRRAVLPTLELPPRHCALQLRVRASDTFTLRPSFMDATSGERTFGKLCVLPSRGPQSRLIQLPLPDYGQLRATLNFEVDPGVTIELIQVQVLEDEADEDAFITILERTANTVEVQVGPLQEPRMLVFLDAKFPGWHAWVNGQRTPIYLANEAFKAIELPAGEHHVRFEFMPASILAGAGISGVTGMLMVVAFILLRPRRTRGEPEAPERGVAVP